MTIYRSFEQWKNGGFLEHGAPRTEEYTAEELHLVEMGWNYGYDAGRAVEQALGKMAENARELGLDYEPAPVQEPIGYFTVNGYDMWEQIDDTSGKPLYEHPVAQTAVQEKCFLCGERVASCTSDVCPKSAQPAVIQQMVDALDHADELLGGNDTLVMNGAAAGRWLLEQPAVQEGRDWSLLEATQESLREHMAEIKRLKAAQPEIKLKGKNHG